MPVVINGSTGISGTDGSAAAPAVQGTDTNTGMYFPGNDRIAFAEGGVQVGEFDASANFLFNSGFGSVGIAYGCRAWVNFNGTGTVAIRGSGNVSSIADIGVGLYVVNYTTAMPDANYSCVAIGSSDGLTAVMVGIEGSAAAMTTTATTIRPWNNSGTNVDRAVILFVAFR